MLKDQAPLRIPSAPSRAPRAPVGERRSAAARRCTPWRERRWPRGTARQGERQALKVDVGLESGLVDTVVAS